MSQIPYPALAAQLPLPPAWNAGQGAPANWKCHPPLSLLFLPQLPYLACQPPPTLVSAHAQGQEEASKNSFPPSRPCGSGQDTSQTCTTMGMKLPSKPRVEASEHLSLSKTAGTITDPQPTIRGIN